jgi:hypothetical protein
MYFKLRPNKVAMVSDLIVYPLRSNLNASIGYNTIKKNGK